MLSIPTPFSVGVSCLPCVLLIGKPSVEASDLMVLGFWSSFLWGQKLEDCLLCELHCACCEWKPQQFQPPVLDPQSSGFPSSFQEGLCTVANVQEDNRPWGRTLASKWQEREMNQQMRVFFTVALDGSFLLIAISMAYEDWVTALCSSGKPRPS